jgi:hypothetical protein
MHKNVEFDADFKTIGKVAEKSINPNMHKMAPNNQNIFWYVFEFNFAQKG